jgi:4-hydroxybenzoate polyprenyltransferase
MIGTLVTYSRMIKLSHSIFAMPFALSAAVLASREVAVGWAQVGWIIVCMVSARSSAMGFNRLVDREYDARNPRTVSREIPSGQISVRAAWGFTVASAALFVASSGQLGTATLLLSPIALAVIWGYSLAKRFTSWCHLVLGAALALAPSAVWIALTGGFSAVPALLSVVVASWVAGFDILYACQDAEFDRSEGLRSIPARWGVARALGISAALHIVTVAALLALPAVTALSWPYFVGVGVIGAVLAYEHSIVRPGDLSRIDKAFFDLNGYVSLLFFVFVWLA